MKCDFWSKAFEMNSGVFKIGMNVGIPIGYETGFNDLEIESGYIYIHVVDYKLIDILDFKQAMRRKKIDQL